MNINKTNNNNTFRFEKRKGIYWLRTFTMLIHY